jgi:hypothetical protein
MRARRVCHCVEFVTDEGVRIVFDEDGWHLVNPRQLGHVALKRAEELVTRAEGHAEKTPSDQLGDDEHLGRAEYVARKLRLRVTHRRMKLIEY